MRRRTFLQHTGLATIPLLINGSRLTTIAKSQFLTAGMEDNDHVLVLVQLNGGNDGLNTLVPLDQYDTLAHLRSNIMTPTQRLLPMTDNNSLHTSLGGFRSLYEQEYLGVVQSVGYPNQNRSHFRSNDIWVTASRSDEFITSGWLGRVLGAQHPDFPDGYPNDTYTDPLAISVGQIVSETCQGSSINYSHTVEDPLANGDLGDPSGGFQDNSCYGKELSFIKVAIEQANAYSGIVAEAYEKGTNTVNYQRPLVGLTGLFKQLQIVARLISGGLKTRIYVVSLGGFDTHGDQIESGQPLRGIHANLLQELGDSIALFQQDLVSQALDHRVLGMTFSEFGRQIHSNDSLGTDHGDAAPLFLFGSCVQPNVLGHNPIIDSNTPLKAGVPMQYDFRSVYGSVLVDWLGIDPAMVRSLIFEDYQQLPLLKACGNPVPTTAIDAFVKEIKLFPNPSTEEVNLSWKTYGGDISLQIYNTTGALMMTQPTIRSSSGFFQTRINLLHYPSGHYYVRVMDGSRIATIPFTKL